MKKMLTVLALVAVFGLTLFVNGYAMGSKPKTEPTVRDSDVQGLIGAEVKNPGGEILGSIRDFISDQGGHVIFAVLNHEGKDLAIPYSALSISGTKAGEMSAVLNVDKEKLEGAPEFDRAKAMTDRKWAENVYRYFGQQPYWTEEEAQPATVPGRGGVGY